MLTMLLVLLMFAEFISCALVISASAWLRYLFRRYLYGPTVHEDWHATGARYIVPPLSAITIGTFVVLLLTSRGQQGYRSNSSPPDVKSMLVFDVVFGVILAALVVLLVVEARRYRGRHQEVSYAQRLAEKDDARTRRAKGRRQTRGQRRQTAL